jgi:hypothetical protein
VTRRFPPPWSVEGTDACFIVRDHNGQKLAYVYFEDRRFRVFVRAIFAFRVFGRAVFLAAIR